jgi:hypothetical protein
MDTTGMTGTACRKMFKAKWGGHDNRTRLRPIMNFLEEIIELSRLTAPMVNP